MNSKNIILITLSLLLIASYSMGQNTLDSTALIITETGNVGIDNPVPESKLDVGTNGPFTGKLIRAIGHSNDDNAANIEIGDGSTIHWRLLRLTNNNFRTKMSGDWSILGGNVGIDNPTPQSKLDVGTNKPFTGKLIRAIGHSNEANAAHLEIGDGGPMYWRLLGHADNTFSTKMSGNWSILGGNIGIDNSRPSAKLDIGKNEQFAGKLIRLIGFTDETNSAHFEIGDGGSIYWRLRRLRSNTFQTKMSGDWSIVGGNVGIGVANPLEKLHVEGKVKATHGCIRSSDIRLKKNIEEIKNPLEKIDSLKGVSFNWIDESINEKKEIGVIAQNVETVFPEAVDTDTEGYKSVDYAKLIAPLIEAVKILKQENEELKKQLIFLSEEVGALK